MQKILLLLIFSIFVNAQTIKIASYNVENFFDLVYDKTEYNEYIPNSNTLWNQRNFNIKLNNLLRVINDLDADIIALQEIENIELMKLLKQKLPQYSYSSFTKYQNSAVGLGFLSKIEIKNSQILDVKFQNAIYRPILENTFKVDNIEFKIFNNHWPSKRTSENYRIKYAQALYDRIKALPKDYDYILLGDFNSDYNEFLTFKYNKKLNQTSGLTGINHILNSVINNEFVTYDDIFTYNKRVHYNLWLDLKTELRFSTKFKDQNNTPDNILLPPSLFDNKNLSYIPYSFNVFKPSYLFENNKILRWQMSKDFKPIHKGYGFSDHLPIFALFSIKKEDTKPLKDVTLEQNIVDIKTLYNKDKLIFPAFLNNVIVIYKANDKAIIKEKDGRAILIFKNTQDLKLGYSYHLQINQIYNFYGLKEIKDFIILKEVEEIKSYQELFLDTKNADIFDFKYENEVVTNLKGFVSKGKLLLENNKMIKLFSKDKNILPKDGETILIKQAQLGSFKGNMQIILNENSDYEVIK